MASTVASSAVDVFSVDRRPAKASLRKAETRVNAMWVLLGGAIDSVRKGAGLSLKEFADALGRNERQVARWFEGKERPQVDAVLAVKAFRVPLVLALGKLAGIEFETVMRVRLG